MENKIILKVGEYTILKEKIKGDDVIIYIRDHVNDIDRKLIKLK